MKNNIQNKLKFKDFRIFIIKRYLKLNNLFFVFGGLNTNANDWITIQQKQLKKYHFNYYKIFNKTTQKILQDSIYRNLKNTIHTITLFLSFNKLYSSKKQLFNMEDFYFISLKMNFNFYTEYQVKYLNSFNYKTNALAVYQSLNTVLKYHDISNKYKYVNTSK